MKVLVTGAEGFIGRALAARLIHDRALGSRTIKTLLLFDLNSRAGNDPAFVSRVGGDIANASCLREILAQPVDLIFHLASIPGGTAEQNYDLSRRINLDATLALLERCKAQVDKGGQPPIFVFASTIAVFGRMPREVDEHTLPQPLMTYGAQKLIGEILASDFSRRGWADARSLRLPGVLARPQTKTGHISAFLSDMIRELAAGRPFVCPMSSTATTWASSLPCVVDNLKHLACMPIAASCDERTFTLPTRRFSMSELVDAIGNAYGTPARDLVTYRPDPRIETLFGEFPPLQTPAAERVGLHRDSSLEELVKLALRDADEQPMATARNEVG